MSLESSIQDETKAILNCWMNDLKVETSLSSNKKVPLTKATDQILKNLAKVEKSTQEEYSVQSLLSKKDVYKNDSFLLDQELELQRQKENLEIAKALTSTYKRKQSTFWASARESLSIDESIPESQPSTPRKDFRKKKDVLASENDGMFMSSKHFISPPVQKTLTVVKTPRSSKPKYRTKQSSKKILAPLMVTNSFSADSSGNSTFDRVEKQSSLKHVARKKPKNVERKSLQKFNESMKSSDHSFEVTNIRNQAKDKRRNSANSNESNLFDVSHLISKDNPHFSNSLPKGNQLMRSIDKSSRRYPPEIRRQMNLHPELFTETHAKPDQSDELEKKLKELTQKLQEERKMHDQATKKLRKLEIEKKEESIQRLENEKQMLIQSQQKARKNLLNERLESFLVNKLLIDKRKLFLRWRKIIEPRLKFLRDIEYRFQWRLKLRYFHKIRNVIKQKKDIFERKMVQRRLIKEKKCNEAADRFFRLRLYSKYFLKMQLEFKLRKQQRLIRQNRLMRRQKMDTFLENLVQETIPQQNFDITVTQRKPSKVETPKSTNSSLPEHKEGKNQSYISNETSRNSREDLEIAHPKSPKVNPKSKTPTSQRKQTTYAKPIYIEAEEVSTEKRTKKSSKQSDPTATMAARQKERLEKRKQLEDRYRKIKEEKERKRLEEEARLEEEEKMKKRAILLEKKRKEREKKQELEDKKRRQQEYKEKKKQAIKFRQELLLRYYGWIPWRKFVSFRYEEMETASKMYEKLLKKRLFQCLRRNWNQKMKLIENNQRIAAKKIQIVFENLLLTRYYHCLKEALLSSLHERNSQAKCHYEVKLKRKTFNHIWNELRSQREKRLKWEAEQTGKINEFRIKWLRKRAIAIWKLFTEQSKEAKLEKEIGKDLKMKAQSWLSEFRLQNDMIWE